MKVFISWSGEKSKEVAEVFKDWIPSIINEADPFLSSDDIDKGARWSTNIAKELEDTSFGILCVTKDNLASEWLNFEAGALSKSIKEAKVCPFLVDLEKSEIPHNSPISQFQATSLTKDDVLMLFKSMNASLENRIAEDVLTRTFEACWPEIENAFKKASSTPNAGDSSVKKPKVSPAEIDEILKLLQSMHRLLNSPEDLLPKSYLSGILNDAKFKYVFTAFDPTNDDKKIRFSIKSPESRKFNHYRDYILPPNYFESVAKALFDSNEDEDEDDKKSL